MEIPFVFSTGTVKPGTYKGKATVIPSIGDPIEVGLSANVL